MNKIVTHSSACHAFINLIKYINRNHLTLRNTAHHLLGQQSHVTFRNVSKLAPLNWRLMNLKKKKSLAIKCATVCKPDLDELV